MIEIVSRYDKTKVLYRAESAQDVRTALQEAVSSGADLGDAYLRGADLGDAYLRGAYLGDAYLRDADLSDAYLRDADLSDADLSDADLSGADLSGAYLSDDITYRHPLWVFRVDYLAVLDAAPAEVAGLREALLAGNVDGSTYEGECACLVGTIANVRHEPVEELKAKLHADPNRPAEQWFVPIRRGDEPSTEPENEGQFRAQKALEWLDEWRESRGRIAEALEGSAA